MRLGLAPLLALIALGARLLVVHLAASAVTTAYTNHNSRRDTAATSSAPPASATFGAPTRGHRDDAIAALTSQVAKLADALARTELAVRRNDENVRAMLRMMGRPGFGAQAHAGGGASGAAAADAGGGLSEPGMRASAALLAKAISELEASFAGKAAPPSGGAAPAAANSGDERRQEPAAAAPEPERRKPARKRRPHDTAKDWEAEWEAEDRLERVLDELGRHVEGLKVDLTSKLKLSTEAAQVLKGVSSASNDVAARGKAAETSDGDDFDVKDVDA